MVKETRRSRTVGHSQAVSILQCARWCFVLRVPNQGLLLAVSYKGGRAERDGRDAYDLGLP